MGDRKSDGRLSSVEQSKSGYTDGRRGLGRICRLCRRRNMNWKTGTRIERKAAEASIDPTVSVVYAQKSTFPVHPVTRRTGKLSGDWLFEQVESWMISSWVRRGRLRLKRCKRQKAGPEDRTFTLLSLTSHTSQVQNEMSVCGRGKEQQGREGVIRLLNA